MHSLEQKPEEIGYAGFWSAQTGVPHFCRWLLLFFFFFCSHLPRLLTSVETNVLITYLIAVYVHRNQITKLGLWVDAHAALLLLGNENSMIS